MWIAQPSPVAVWRRQANGAAFSVERPFALDRTTSPTPSGSHAPWFSMDQLEACA